MYIRILIMIFALLSVSSFAKAQWEEHFSYGGCAYGGACKGGAFAGNSLAFYSYDMDDMSISKYSKINCLSAANISAVDYSDGYFFVGYSDGAIDIVKESNLSTRTINDLKRSDVVVLKSVSSFYKYGTHLYCAFASGLLDINLSKYETRGYYKMLPSTPAARDVVVFNDSIYVATSSGIMVASAQNNLLENVNNWKRVADNSSSFCDLMVIDDRLYAAMGSWGSVCDICEIPSSSQIFKKRTVQSYRGTASKSGKALFASVNSIAIADVKDLSQNIATISAFSFLENGEAVSATPNLRSISFVSPDIISCADASQGLVISDLSGNAERHWVNSPSNTYAHDVLFSNGTLYATFGGLTGAYDNQNRAAGVHIFSDGKWSSYAQSGRDMIELCVNPNAPDTVYASTWGTGIMKIERGKGITQRYNEYNSTLEDIFSPGRQYVRCGSLTFDKGGNLYVQNAETPIGIKVRLADGTWTSGLSYAITDGLHSVRDIVTTSNDNIWILIPRTDYRGLMVFNTNGTPEDQSDDLYRSTVEPKIKDSNFIGKLPVVDQDGEELPPYYYALAEDKDGVLWIGTSDGVYRFAHNDIVLKDVAHSQYLEHVKVPRNDGTNLADYLLGGVQVSSIIIDSENRKWFGTYTDGLYLVSADGMRMLEHFTEGNSPLPSNQINAMTYDEKSGKIYISVGTIGIVAYQTDSKNEGDDKHDDIDAHIYPNPVLPSFTGDVTIEGLPDDTDVRISDVQGRLVYSGKSSNGVLYWNTARFGYGPRVAPGIYIVWIQTMDAKQKAVGKIAIIK